MKNKTLLISVILLCIANYATAESISGIHFIHNDWEIACDNTRTCRAAGYQSDEDELSVSVLLTRKAGAQQSVHGELMFGSYGEQTEDALPPSIEMEINNQSIGYLTVNQSNSVAQLSGLQVNALLKALPHTSVIQFIGGNQTWHLSDQGATAVLLKMDEFQGRIDTESALVRKGKKSESSVLPALPVPVIFAASTVNKKPDNTEREILITALKKSINRDDCGDFFENEIEQTEFNAYQLSTTKWLVSVRCWQAAYNSGYGYWIVDQQLPHNVIFVTESGTDYSNGVISASQKGRGLGDCWSSESWVWDGKLFVQSEITTSGMCKLVAAGGAWSLPTFVSDVPKQ